VSQGEVRVFGYRSQTNASGQSRWLVVGRVNPVGGAWCWLMLDFMVVCGRWLLESRGPTIDHRVPNLESPSWTLVCIPLPSSLLHTQTKTDILAYRHRRLQVQTAQTMTPISVHDKPPGFPACKRLNVWRQASGFSKPRIQNWGRVSTGLSSIPTGSPSSKFPQPAKVAVSSSLDQAA